MLSAFMLKGKKPLEIACILQKFYKQFMIKVIHVKRVYVNEVSLYHFIVYYYYLMYVLYVYTYICKHKFNILIELFYIHIN